MSGHYLVELASGYLLVKNTGTDTFAKVSFQPFSSADEALENSLAVAEGRLHDTLQNWLQLQVEGKKKFFLGVSDATLGKAIQDALGTQCQCDDSVHEAIRKIRQSVAKILPEVPAPALKQAQVGLAHAYSRNKVQFNVKRSDNMVIQAISVLDQMDKDINTFAMRVREWYGYHFPEMAKIVNDNVQYCKLVLLLKHKANLQDDYRTNILDILGEEEKTDVVIELSKQSMGSDFVEQDMDSVCMFAEKVLNLLKMRENMQGYLHEKVNSISPNLAALVNEQIAARLICQAGSLTNLAKYPASTVQILGAEKALFRALKQRGKGKTPKYGLIYHTSFIGRATGQNKGRISRYLANKAAMACRLDCFMEKPNRVIGEMLKDQVDSRLKFLESGATEGDPSKNDEFMDEVMDKYNQSLGAMADVKVERRKKRKKVSSGEAVAVEPTAEEAAVDADDDAAEQERKRLRKLERKKKRAALE